MLADTPLSVNRSYSFHYPDFSGQGDEGYYRVHLLVQHIYQWNSLWMVKGRNLDTGKPEGCYYEYMRDVRPIYPESSPMLARKALHVVAGCLALLGQAGSVIDQTITLSAPQALARCADA